ncbi:hypothetical protein C8J57DRAFT_1525477 [Mycena rebaudengoi]|nr:hypothetical protein C8J57DRAFT_1525477 [Mycena rebaudengoi]
MRSPTATVISPVDSPRLHFDPPAPEIWLAVAIGCLFCYLFCRWPAVSVICERFDPAEYANDILEVVVEAAPDGEPDLLGTPARIFVQAVVDQPHPTSPLVLVPPLTPPLKFLATAPQAEAFQTPTTTPQGQPPILSPTANLLVNFAADLLVLRLPTNPSDTAPLPAFNDLTDYSPSRGRAAAERTPLETAVIDALEELQVKHEGHIQVGATGDEDPVRYSVLDAVRRFESLNAERGKNPERETVSGARVGAVRAIVGQWMVSPPHVGNAAEWTALRPEEEIVCGIIVAPGDMKTIEEIMALDSGLD